MYNEQENRSVDYMSEVEQPVSRISTKRKKRWLFEKSSCVCFECSNFRRAGGRKLLWG